MTTARKQLWVLIGLATLLMAFAAGPGFGQSVSLDHVEGLCAPDTLFADSVIVFHIRMTAGGSNYRGITNGLRVYSPDGVDWIGTAADTTGTLTGNDFDLVWLISYFSADGLGADTIGIAGLVMNNPVGMPPDFDDITHTIRVGPIDGYYHGNSICLDSAWYPWGGYWKWSISSGNDVIPSWDGPHCFVVRDTVSDDDQDGVINIRDNCVSVPNPDQSDIDLDSVGDVCDNCPTVYNPTQADFDVDSVGTLCDNCPQHSNHDQADLDADSVGDVCDNCPTESNLDQSDVDRDLIGDACDNCPNDDNPGQSDGDGDSIGDVCDNCPLVANTDQADVDNDDVGDACDTCVDSDGDGFANPGYPATTCGVDNCPGIYNPDQADADGDGVGDACSCCVQRGDMDHDGTAINITDLIYMVSFVFQGGPPPPCTEESDVNGAYDGLNISDLVFMVSYMFMSGPPPPDCIPAS